MFISKTEEPSWHPNLICLFDKSTTFPDGEAFRDQIDQKKLQRMVETSLTRRYNSDNKLLNVPKWIQRGPYLQHYLHFQKKFESIANPYKKEPKSNRLNHSVDHVKPYPSLLLDDNDPNDNADIIPVRQLNAVRGGRSKQVVPMAPKIRVVNRRRSDCSFLSGGLPQKQLKVDSMIIFHLPQARSHSFKDYTTKLKAINSLRRPSKMVDRRTSMRAGSPTVIPRSDNDSPLIKLPETPVRSKQSQYGMDFRNFDRPGSNTRPRDNSENDRPNSQNHSTTSQNTQTTIYPPQIPINSVHASRAMKLAALVTPKSKPATPSNRNPLAMQKKLASSTISLNTETPEKFMIQSFTPKPRADTRAIKLLSTLPFSPIKAHQERMTTMIKERKQSQEKSAKIKIHVIQKFQQKLIKNVYSSAKEQPQAIKNYQVPFFLPKQTNHFSTPVNLHRTANFEKEIKTPKHKPPNLRASMELGSYKIDMSKDEIEIPLRSSETLPTLQYGPNSPPSFKLRKFLNKSINSVENLYKKKKSILTE